MENVQISISTGNEGPRSYNAHFIANSWIWPGDQSQRYQRQSQHRNHIVHRNRQCNVTGDRTLFRIPIEMHSVRYCWDHCTATDHLPLIWRSDMLRVVGWVKLWKKSAHNIFRTQTDRPDSRVAVWDRFQRMDAILGDACAEKDATVTEHYPFEFHVPMKERLLSFNAAWIGGQVMSVDRSIVRWMGTDLQYSAVNNSWTMKGNSDTERWSVDLYWKCPHASPTQEY